MKNKIVDTHCHLDFEDFDDDLTEVIENAQSNNVKCMLSISVDLKKFKSIYDITQKYKNIWCSTGVHPNNVPSEMSKNKVQDLYSKLNDNLLKKKVIGVGETGLDFFRNSKNKENQINYFKTHIEVAGRNNVPLIVHTREADEDTIFYLNKYVKKFNTSGLIHCFSSGLPLAKTALDNGFYISFSGIITFKKAEELKEIVKYIPLKRILVETDSPYLAPVPHRGKRNEPAFTKLVLQRIAEIKKVNIEKVAQETTNNFFNLFTRATYES